MYLDGYKRMNGMGLAITMPSVAYRTGTAIRAVTRAPIPSVNKPVVSTPTSVPAPSRVFVPAPIVPITYPQPSTYWGGNPPRYTPPILPAPRPTPTPIWPTPAPVMTPQVSTAENPMQRIFPVGPIYGPRPPILPAPRPTPIPVASPTINVGTPVPAGYPTSQIFVNTDGSFWQYSSAQSQWINVGTPYNTGANATPAAPPPSSSGASTAAPAGTTAPAPVNVSVAPAASSYQEIFDWLQEDTLLSSIGFAGIPNWIAAGAGALLLYKVSSGSGGRR